MQILLVFFLTALVGCYGEESECFQRTKSCEDEYMKMFEDGDALVYEYCKGLVIAIECLEKAVVESCAAGELKDNSTKKMEQMKESRDEYCNMPNLLSVLSDEDEIQTCFEANKEYVHKCKFDAIPEIWDALQDQQDADDIHFRFVCSTFMRTGECVIKRVEEKCGAKAALEAMRQIEIPDYANEACLSIGIALQSGVRGEDKRKK